MTTGMHLWDADVWSFVLTLSLLFAAMIATNILRRLCPFIRKALIPSSVLGGFLLREKVKKSALFCALLSSEVTVSIFLLV